MDKKDRFDPRVAAWRHLRLTPAALACSLMVACGGSKGPEADTAFETGAITLSQSASSDERSSDPATAGDPAVAAIVEGQPAVPTPEGFAPQAPGGQGEEERTFNLDVAGVGESAEVDRQALDVADGRMRPLSAAQTVPSTGGWIEAESGTVGGGARVLSAGAASGARSVGWMHINGAHLQHAVQTTQAGTFDLVLRYAVGNPATGELSLLLNGRRVQTLTLPSTGGWTTFAQITVARVTLPAGRSTLRIQRDPGSSSSADLDRFILTRVTAGSAPAPVPAPVAPPVAPPVPAPVSAPAPLPAAAPAPAPMPAPVPAPAPITAPAPSGSFPAVNTSLIPAARPGSNTLDISTTGEMPRRDAGGIGAFRNVCQYSHMNFDDALVFPGMPGATHLHTYFGNTGARFDSTAQSIGNSGGSSCRGGTANRSAYWVPSMIDTRNGRPLAPSLIHVYYKTGYNGINDAAIKPWPKGFRMISGAASSRVAQSQVFYKCNGGPSQSFIPSCNGKLSMSVVFPQCWDGVNLSAPDNKSHVAFPSGGRCPSTHPVPTPELAIHLDYATTFGDSSTWRLSSDVNGAPAGSSGHADWINGWDTELMNTWVSRVINPGLSGGSHMIGDGRVMNCRFPGCV